jgi:hypothetical protein
MKMEERRNTELDGKKERNVNLKNEIATRNKTG